MWWIIVPTLVLAFLRRDPASTVMAALIGAGLRFAQSYQGIPAPLRGFLSYLPAVQILVVYVLLGGSLTTALLVVGVVAVAVVFRNPLIRALGPWWRLQASIPMIVRRAIAFGLPFLIGYYYGLNAGGAEYTTTLLSVSLGTVVGFMMLFTPPGFTHPITSPPA